MIDLQPIVYLVDDNQSVRKALTLALRRKGFKVMAFESAKKFLEAYTNNRPSCLVLDVKMPGVSGLELQDILVKKENKIPIIFITGHGDVPTSVKAFKAGAIDFLEKPFNYNELAKRIEEALDMDTHRQINASKEKVILNRFKNLTSREKEIMSKLVAGRADSSNKHIAMQLGISYRTVEVHRKSVFGKMQATSLTELVEMAKICKIYVSSPNREITIDLNSSR